MSAPSKGLNGLRCCLASSNIDMGVNIRGGLYR